MAILDKTGPGYDLKGRAWLYLTMQCLAMIYRAGSGNT